MCYIAGIEWEYTYLWTFMHLESNAKYLLKFVYLMLIKLNEITLLSMKICQWSSLKRVRMDYFCEIVFPYIVGIEYKYIVIHERLSYTLGIEWK